MNNNPVFHKRHRLATHRLANSSLVILLFALGLTRQVMASPLAYEGFNYLANQPLPAMTGGFGWAPGPWTQLGGVMVDQPPTLSYPTALPSTGDSLLTQVPGAASRAFLTPFDNLGNDLWISFQELNAIGALPGAEVHIQQPIAVLPDIEVNKDVGNAVTLNGLPAGFATGLGADLFVLQLVQWNGTGTLVNLFVDPGLVLGPPSASVLITGSAFQAQQFYYQSNDGQELDEIRIGTTFQDVAVPEPSTLTMLAGGLLLLPFTALIKRRRVKAQLHVRNNGVIILLLGFAVGTTRLASAQFDPSLQFSPISNPNTVWSYGYESVPIGSPFNFLTLPLPIPALPGPTIDSWQNPAFGAIGVFHNGTAVPQTVTTVGSEISMFDSGMLAMNAGPNDQFGIVQFTAPVNGFYTIQGVFEGIDTAGTVSSVYLLANNLVVATGNVLGFGPGSDVSLSTGPDSSRCGANTSIRCRRGSFQQHDGID